MSTFALLLMLALGIDHSGTLVSSEKGGGPDLAPQAAESPSQDANADADGTCVRAQPSASVSLRDAIADYRRNGGVKYYVRGKSDAQHVIEDHGWSHEQIRGLTTEEIQFLHGASHTGALSPSDFTKIGGRSITKPSDFAARRVEQESDALPAAVKPRLTIRVAPFHCPPCNQVKRMDWSDFDVDWQTGGRVERGYPEISWRDDSGKKWWKAGAYTPSQIMGLVERTQ